MVGSAVTGLMYALTRGLGLNVDLNFADQKMGLNSMYNPAQSHYDNRQSLFYTQQSLKSSKEHLYKRNLCT